MKFHLKKIYNTKLTYFKQLKENKIKKWIKNKKYRKKIEIEKLKIEKDKENI